MIVIAGQSYHWNDPLILISGGIIALLFVLLLVLLRRTGQSAATADLLARQVQQLGDGQTQLAGSLQTVAQGQANAHHQMEQRLGEVQINLHENLAKVQRSTGENLANMQQGTNDTLAAMQLKLTETLSQSQIKMQENLADLQMKTNRALTDVQAKMNEALQGNAKRTATSLTALQERLATIDKAQENITRLSGDVLTLQDILSNKQTRGAFGEIQLTDIVTKALPPGSFDLQATLSNGKRADCLVHLPNPPGPIVIDSKFPLEPYEAMYAAQTEGELKEAARAFKTAVRTHIQAISDKYIIEGETADGALMFLPSEAVYAELHAKFVDVVQDGFNARVWIVSPTTCMATLNTMRAILKDARMREQAGAIRKALRQLHRDVEIVEERAGKLETHLRQAGDDVQGILTASARAGKRAGRLDSFDFEELAPESDPPNVVPLSKPDP